MRITDLPYDIDLNDADFRRDPYWRSMNETTNEPETTETDEGYFELDGQELDTEFGNGEVTK